MRGFDSRRGLQKNMYVNIDLKALFRTIGSRYIRQFTDRQFLISLIASFALLWVSMMANYYAALYALNRASNPVTDIVLSNIRTFDVEWVFIWGPIVFWVIMGVYLLHDPKRIPFTLKSVALFVIVRSLFISMTHVAPFPDHIPVETYGVDFMQDVFGTSQAFNMALSTGADLFFSAHTGIPYLIALTFWKHRAIRYLSLATSLVLGTAVLLGHLHYTIDVAAAFFMTFSISHLAAFLFKKDKRMFYEDARSPARVPAGAPRQIATAPVSVPIAAAAAEGPSSENQEASRQAA